MVSITPRECPAPLPLTVALPTTLSDEEIEDPISNQVFSTLYNSDKYSDLTIRCQDRVWRAHRAVVCVQSKVLAAAIDGPFLEGTTGEIDLSEDDPEIVEHMMNYLYKGYYDFGNPIASICYTPDPSPKQEWKSWLWRTPPNDSNSCSPPGSTDLTPHYANQQLSLTSNNDPSQNSQAAGATSVPRKAPYPSRLLTHASVYCLAEQYDLRRLKNYALCKYAALVPTAWKSPFFIPSIKLIYDGTPSTSQVDDLRAVAARTAAEHSKYFLDRIEFLEICTENGEIATDVLKSSLLLKELEMNVNWKPKKGCKVDPKHDLVYIPTLPGFGIGTVGPARGTSTSMQGFGSKTGGRYKCISCGTFVE